MRDPLQVALDHLDAVRSGDPVAMAADYADDAVLVRGEDRFAGRAAIEAYFATVPGRLAGGQVAFGSVEPIEGGTRIRWRIEGGPGDGASGHDDLTIAGGEITRQVVYLDSSDF